VCGYEGGCVADERNESAKIPQGMVRGDFQPSTNTRVASAIGWRKKTVSTDVNMYANPLPYHDTVIKHSSFIYVMISNLLLNY
jgi:hypothetical protein